MYYIIFLVYIYIYMYTPRITRIFGCSFFQILPVVTFWLHLVRARISGHAYALLEARELQLNEVVRRNVIL